MVPFKMTVEESFCSFTKSNRLYGIWLAGANWNEFHRNTQLEDITVISVPLICQDITKIMTQPSIAENVQSKKKNNKKTTILFLEISHLTVGIVKVFEYQVKFLYDQVLQCLVQQSKWNLDFNQPSKASNLSIEDNLSRLSPNKASLKRKCDTSSANQPRGKQAKQVKKVSFHWSINLTDEEVQDVETDNEIIMKVLQSSFVMHKQEITIREVEDSADPFTETSQFEATDHSSMQFFHEIRDLVARRLSSDGGNAPRKRNFHEQQFMTDAFNQGNNSTNVIKKSKKDHRNLNLLKELEEDEEEYETDGFNLEHTEQHDSLPDISIYQPVEEHVEPARENEDEYKSAHSLPGISIYQPELNENVPCDDNVLTDSEMQVDAPMSNVNKLNVRESSEPNAHHLDVPVQNTSQAVVKVTSHKRKRQFKDTILQEDFNENYKTNTIRCSHSRLDVFSKADLLRNHFSKLFVQPLHMFKHDLKFRHSKEISFSSKLFNDPKIFTLKRTEETDLEIVNDFLVNGNELRNEEVTKPKLVIQRTKDALEREIQPIRDKDDSATNAFENDSPMLAPDVSVQIEHPCVESCNFVEPAPVEAILNESEKLDLMPLIETPNQFHVKLSPQILKVLKLSDSAKVSNTRWSTDSQKMLMLSNQKNRQEWGVKGIMEHLFWLWNNNVYPIGMKELTQSCESKVAKALTFYSILELNSTRIGLIAIENIPNSNCIYNIAKSKKLNDLLAVDYQRFYISFT